MRAAALLLVLSSISGVDVFAQSNQFYCTGSFNYDVLIEGQKLGSAQIKRERRQGNYQTSSEIAFKMEGITSITKETIVEKTDFSPVSYETDASFVSDKFVSRLKLRSWFADDYLYLNDGRTLTKFRAGGPFHYSTNKMLAMILSLPKVEGASASCSIFDPAVEIKKTLPAKCQHVGNVTVNYKGKIIEAYRILADYGPLKKVEMTVDKNGVIYNYIFIVNGVATQMQLVSYAK